MRYDIAGVGPALVDYIYSIDEYPERGGHAVVKGSIRMPGGACANVIAGLSGYGVRCRFYSTIGRDENAEFFIESMKNVDLKLNVTHELTGRVDVYVDRCGERTFFVHPNSAGIVKLKIDDEDFGEVERFYLDPFPSERSFEVHLKIAKKAKEHGKRVILNPGYPYTKLGFEKLKELLKFTDIVIMSKQEFECLSVEEDDFLKFVEVLVITLGEKGSRALTKDGEFYHPSFKTEVVDTTGAGDAFAVGFLYGRMKGLPLEKCLKLGNFVASYNVRHWGARNFPPKSEVDRLIDLDDL